MVKAVSLSAFSVIAYIAETCLLNFDALLKQKTVMQITTALKTRYFMLPNLITIITLTAGYCFVRWTLDFQLRLITLTESSWHIWLPCLLALLVQALYLRKYFHALDIQPNNSQLRMVFELVPLLCLILPLHFSQPLLEKKTFPLQQITDISEVSSANLNNQRYFSGAPLGINKSLCMGYSNATRSTSDVKPITFELYIVCPLNRSSADSSLWYGKIYQQDSPLLNNDKALNLALLTYSQQALDQFNADNLDDYQYLEALSSPSNQHRYFQLAIKARQQQLSPLNPQQTATLLSPRDTEFAELFNNSWRDFWVAILASVAMLLLFLIIFPAHSTNIVALHSRTHQQSEKYSIRNYLYTLHPSHHWFLFSIITTLCAFAYLTLCSQGADPISPLSATLFHFGANNRAAVIDGEYWRLITSIFLHGGLVHLVMNIYALYFANLYLAKLHRPVLLISLYLICGIVASITSIWWSDNAVSVGASGAIFGLFGAILVWSKLGVYDPQDQLSIKNSIQIFILLTLVIGSLGMFASVFGNFDNAAHIGGLIAGGILGALLCQLKIIPTPYRRHE
jgi:rhomboid protease GluP